VREGRESSSVLFLGCPIDSKADESNGEEAMEEDKKMEENKGRNGCLEEKALLMMLRCSIPPDKPCTVGEPD
jgi:hypothetical protein